LAGIVLLVTLTLFCTSLVATTAQADEGMELAVISAETHHLQPLLQTNIEASRHQPDPRLPALVQQLPAIAAPNATVTQQIIIHNDEAHTRRITVTQQLPSGLEPVTQTDPDSVQWQPAQRRWTWTGDLAGGNRDYTITPTTTEIPYLDLATFGVENLCDQFAETDENDITTVACDDATVTLNIGRQGQSILLYGTAWRSLTLHADGFVSFNEGQAQPAPPQILPHADRALTLAPLHANYNLGYTSTTTSTTQIGRWHAAVIADYLDGRDTLYVQWHNAPLAANLDATVRFALAIPLWTDDETPPEIESAFYIYDNISHPSRLIAAEYSIGLQDGAGERGMSYAHSVDGDVRGYPPSPSVLRVLPVRYGDGVASTKTLTLRWRVTADVPATLVSTVELTSDSLQPPLAQDWATAYLAVRHQTYLPAISGSHDVK
jgi:hypothetical protein